MVGSVSVVIVSKNEERRIGLCLDSVLLATRNMQLAEIVVVDFASTDMTVDVAKKYPVRVLVLPKPDTVAAGRNLGYQQTTGDFVLFLDGNRVLVETGFVEAFSFLEKHPDFGAVSGRIVSELEKECRSRLRRFLQRRVRSFFDTMRTGEVATLNGPVLLYRRRAMQEAGTWNPFIYGGDEAELSYRVSERGYKFFRFPSPIARQVIRCVPVFKYIRKYEWMYNIGVGSSLRLTLATDRKLFMRRASASLYSIALTIFAFYSITSLLLVPLGHFIFFAVALAIQAALLLNGLARGRGMLSCLAYAVTLHSRIISGIATFVGLFKRIGTPADFHPEFVVLK